MPRLAKRAEKDLAEFPKEIGRKAREVLRELDGNPLLGKKLLVALQVKRSARVRRGHRIIYVIEDGGPVVLTIQPRRDAYG